MTKPIIEPIYTREGTHIDDVVLCGACRAFICYRTEHDIIKEYRFCHRCGCRIDWETVDNWAPTNIQPEHKIYVEGLMDANGREWTARLWHEVINGKSIYYDEEGFQVNPTLWRSL